MAQSVKIDFNVWSQFDHHAYDIINEDFVHDHFFKLNANLLTQKGRVRLQENLIKKNDKLDSYGEANIWFPIMENKSFYLQMRNKGFRLHIDNGLFTQNHYQHNLYASLEPNRKLDDFLLKFGCETIAQKWRCNFRYRYSTFDDGHTLYSRWRYDHNNWTFQGIKALRLNDFVPLKHDFLIGYYQQNKIFHLRLLNEDWKTEPFDFNKITLQKLFDLAIFNFTKTINQYSRFGIEASIKITGKLKPASFVFENFDPIYHSTVKLKASSDNSAALSIRNKIGSYGSYVFGMGLKHIGSFNKFSFGVQVDLNL